MPEVDGLRFLAIFAVFVFHVRAYLNGKSSIPWRVPVASDWLGNLALHGDYGVPLFFGISGFMISLPFAEHALRGGAPVSLRAYYLRRLARIEPPYLVSLALMVGLLHLVKGVPFRVLAPHAAASTIYAHGLVYAGANPINVVTWSLEIEAQFYLVAPLLARVFSIRSAVVRRTVLAVAAYGMVAFQPWLVDGNPRLHMSLFGDLQYFLAGFFLADLHVALPAPSRRSTTVWDVVTIVGWPATAFACEFPSLARVVFPALTVVLGAGAFRSRIGRPLLTRSIVTTIGGMCYTVYLLHYAIIAFAGRLTIRVAVTHEFWVNLLAQVALLSGPVLLGSAVFFVVVEKPCMQRDWPARLLAWMRTQARPSITREVSP